MSESTWTGEECELNQCADVMDDKDSLVQDFGLFGDVLGSDFGTSLWR